MTKQMQEETKILRVMNAVAAGTTDQNSTGVNMAGWESVEFVAAFGALTATQVTSLKLQQSSDDGSADAYSDLAGTSSGALADGDGNKLIRLEIVNPEKRYVRAVVDRGTANAVIDGVIAILRRPRSLPITQDASVSKYESHVRPAEGTA
jgi:hypothetical protein